MTMTFLGEPQQNQAVQQHRGRCGAFHGATCPTLRLFEPQVPFAVLIGLFDGRRPYNLKVKVFVRPSGIFFGVGSFRPRFGVRPCCPGLR